MPAWDKQGVDGRMLVRSAPSVGVEKPMPSSSPLIAPHPRPPEPAETPAPAGPGDLHVTFPTGLCTKAAAEPRLVSPASRVRECLNPHQPVKLPTDVGQTRHHPHLINQEEISAARPSGKCSFPDRGRRRQVLLRDPRGALSWGFAFTCAAVKRGSRPWGVAAATIWTRPLAWPA